MSEPCEFRLPLAPPETLGRRFQYALLSIDPSRVKVNEAQGYACFNSKRDYLDLIGKALDALKAWVVEQGGKRDKESCQVLKVSGVKVNCCNLDSGPWLYGAGLTSIRENRDIGETHLSDYLTLRLVRFTACQPPSKGKGKGKGSTGTDESKMRVTWNHAAVSYAYEVLSKGSPLDGEAPDLPWLAKATIFGSMRATGRGRYTGAYQTTLDVLGSVLLGGALSFLWGETLSESREETRKSRVEFYLVPDAVHQGFWTLRGIMLRRKVSNGTMARALRLARDFPVSAEVAASITLAEDLASSLGPASQLSSYLQAVQLERVATVVAVKHQQRPLVTSVIPLSLAVYAAFSESSLKAVSAAARGAWKVVTKGKVQGLRDVIGNCLNAMYLQAANPRWSDHLSSCIRSLYAAADNVESKFPDLAGKLRWAAKKLAKDYVKLQSRAWG